jgi:hypothetical protein
MDDDMIMARGGTQEDMDDYAERHCPELTKEEAEEWFKEMHPKNPEDPEGNCRPTICPLLIKDVNLLKCETCQYLKECEEHNGALTEVENCSAIKGTHFCKASWDPFVALMDK